MYGPYFGSTIEALYYSGQGDAPGAGSTPAAGGPTAIPENPAPVVTPRAKCKKHKKHRRKKRRCATNR